MQLNLKEKEKSVNENVLQKVMIMKKKIQKKGFHLPQNENLFLSSMIMTPSKIIFLNLILLKSLRMA